MQYAHIHLYVIYHLTGRVCPTYIDALHFHITESLTLYFPTYKNILIAGKSLIDVTKFEKCLRSKITDTRYLKFHLKSVSYIVVF